MPTVVAYGNARIPGPAQATLWNRESAHELDCGRLSAAYPKHSRLSRYSSKAAAQREIGRGVATRIGVDSSYSETRRPAAVTTKGDIVACVGSGALQLEMRRVAVAEVNQAACQGVESHPESILGEHAEAIGHGRRAHQRGLQRAAAAGTLNALTNPTVLPETNWKIPANPPCPGTVKVAETAPAVLLVAVVSVVHVLFKSANGQNWRL
jgi:hypothetical protein